MAKSEASLDKYHSKRDFTKTKEPKGESQKGKASGGKFVIQKHDATNLHYDLRLEIDGVYKSWAVPKGPSLNSNNKRLAVEVEDHPLEYGKFEGTIPEGEYGGGTVMLWDRGTFKCDTDAGQEWSDGSMKVTFDGERMNGKWALILMHTHRGGDDDKRNWLLIKEHDGKDSEDEPDLIEKYETSVTTDREMDEIASDKPTVKKSRQKPE